MTERTDDPLLSERRQYLATLIRWYLRPDAIYSEWRPSMGDMEVIANALAAQPSGTPDRDAVLEEWSREVRVTIRGIDGQAKRRTHRSHFQGQTEEIIDGYELNTGLWHKLLGLLATCPSPEGVIKNAASQEPRSSASTGTDASDTGQSGTPAAAASNRAVDTEYICKCGVRVVPHRCNISEEF